MLQIFYGVNDKRINITKKVFRELKKGIYVHIPKDDVLRAHIFGDAVWGVLKWIYINGKEYNHIQDIYIDDKENVYTNIDVPFYIKEVFENVNYFIDYEKQTRDIHKLLSIEYGHLTQEFPEQMISVRYLKGDEKVLELGGNVGRNSLIIGHILNKNNNTNFVTLECNILDAKKLAYNRDLNELKFHIEDAALSERKLIQREWNTMPSDEVLPGFVSVNTITWNQLLEKYRINFDTLVIDCEGAFYYILQDTPQMLDNIKLIIVENDYFDPIEKGKYNIEQKEYVDNILINKGFYLDYMSYHLGDRIYNNFYEVWRRD
jgi:FkbM family methyltransferase